MSTFAAFLVMDKPAGLTSHDVVGIVRACTGEPKVGHTGTLDPFATGVLALALGQGTRLIQYLDESVKVYDATIRLGTTTDTGDPTGTVVGEGPVPTLDPAAVAELLQGFIGERQQVPPAYSAVKVNGRPLYDYARKGEAVEAAPRTIIVRSMELLEHGEGWLRVLMTCGRGTYARGLAEEIAAALGTVGHLEALSRRQSGPFHLDGALGLDRLGEIVSADPDRTWEEVFAGPKVPREQRVPWKSRQDVRDGVRPRLITPLQALSHLPLLDVDAEGARRVRSGAAPGRLPAGLKIGGRYLLVHGDELLAVAESGARGPALLCVLGQGG